MITRREKPAEMSAADKAAKGETLLAKYLAGDRDTHPDELGPGKPFIWRRLNGDETQLAIAAAHARFADLQIPTELRFGEDIRAETEWQILALAMRHPEDVEEPLARDAGELRKYLPDHARIELFQRYADFEEALSPDPSDDPALMAQITEAVKKNNWTLLSAFGWKKLAAWGLCTVRPLLLSTESSSGTPGSS